MEQQYLTLSESEAADKLKSLSGLSETIDACFDYVRDEATIDELNARLSQALMLGSMAEAGQWHTDYDSWVADSKSRIKEIEKKRPTKPGEEPAKKNRR